MKVMRSEYWLAAGLVGAVVVGCRASNDGSTRPAPSGPVVPAASVNVKPAQTMLDSIDERTPVPLLPMMANHQKQNMRDHLLVVQEITAAIATKDFDAIAKSASRIGFSEQMGQMCTHMGAGAPGFTEQALNFHHTADRIGQAAGSRDLAGVLNALGETLATCTSCHAKFKQQVVDDETWASVTKMAAPTGAMHH